jgi:RNA polymerase sigma factor (sigma-70 family)
MTESVSSLHNCLERLKKGDLTARGELIARVSGRLNALAGRMLRDYPGVARWEEADDVFQQAALRLHRSLEEFVPSTPEEFLRFGALQLRRQLTDMARHYFGPHGHGANNAGPGAQTNSSAAGPGQHPSDSSSNPEKLAIWTELHGAIDKLPEIEQKVVDLLWYHELGQTEAAEVLQVSVRQVRRYWQSARLKLQQHLGNSARPW